MNLGLADLFSPNVDALPGGSPLPPRAACLSRRVQPGPRRKRRTENHGHHRAPAHRRRQTSWSISTNAAKMHHKIGHEHDRSPLWVILSCQSAIALGTMAGGWRIVRTMGSGITRLQPVGGSQAKPPPPSPSSARYYRRRFRSQRRTPSPAQSLASEPPRACARCAGSGVSAS